MISPELKNGGVNAVISVSWFNVPLDEDGAYIELPNHSDKTVHCFGTFGGGSITLYGSNDTRVVTDLANASWVALKDIQGNVITMNAAGMAFIPDNPRYIKVRTTGGDGTTAISAVICAKRA